MNRILVIIFICISSLCYGKITDRFQTPEDRLQCLNCCSFSGTQEVCSPSHESSYRNLFYLHRIALLAGSALPFLTQLNQIRQLDLRLRLANLFWLLPSLGRFVLVNTQQIYQTASTPRTISTQSPKGVIVILRSQKDWNFALSSPYISDLSEYLVILQDVKNLFDAYNSVKVIRKKFKFPIKGLVLFAHGNEDSIQIGDELLDGQNLGFKYMFNLLDREASIFINSCLADSRQNIAHPAAGSKIQQLALVADGRKIYATSDFSSPFTQIDSHLNPVYNSISTFMLPFAFINWGQVLGLTRCYQKNEQGEVLSCVNKEKV
ncbi:MAG: hypothetical protein ACH349_06800 [Candidatus Rhabdochlamydia sp.]